MSKNGTPRFFPKFDGIMPHFFGAPILLTSAAGFVVLGCIFFQKFMYHDLWL